MSGADHDWVTTADGIRLRVESHGPADAAAAVVLVHGFAASGTDADVVAVRDALVSDGYAVHTYDARGHGASGGLCTLGDLERHDVAALTAAARAGHERVVLVGASMGAIAALRYAAVTSERIDGVVAISSPAFWRVPTTPRGWFSTALTRTAAGRRFLRRQGIRVSPKWTKPDPPVDLVRHIDAPVAFIHGHRDRWIHPKASLDLHRVTREKRRLELVAGMGHAFDPKGIPAIRAAVAWVLRQAQPRTPGSAVPGCA